MKRQLVDVCSFTSQYIYLLCNCTCVYLCSWGLTHGSMLRDASAPSLRTWWVTCTTALHHAVYMNMHNCANLCTVELLCKGHAGTIPLYEGVLYSEVKLYTKVLAIESKQVSFIERCPLFGVSFTRGSTVVPSITSHVHVQAKHMILLKDSTVHEIIRFLEHCEGKHILPYFTA